MVVLYPAVGGVNLSTLPTSESIATAWLREGRRVVNAMLVERIGSAPLDPGAQMLVDGTARSRAR